MPGTSGGTAHDHPRRAGPDHRRDDDRARGAHHDRPAGGPQLARPPRLPGPGRGLARAPLRRRPLAGDRHRRARQLHVGRGPQDVHPAGDRAGQGDRQGRGHGDRRLPARRRDAGRAAGREDLQADRRGHRRPVRGRWHGDARRRRHPHRHPERELRGDGAQAWPVRRRRDDGPPPPAAGLPGGDGVPPDRRGVPGGTGARARADQRDRRTRPAAPAGGGVGPSHPRQRAARGAGDEGVRHPGPQRHAGRRLRDRAGALPAGLRHRGRQGGPAGVQGEARAGVAGPGTAPIAEFGGES